MVAKPEGKLSILKPSGVLHWATHNFLRFDDTRKSVLKFALRPPRVSLAPINRLCADLAYRRLSYEEALKKCEHYSGYLRRAADEFLPAFAEYLEKNQTETTDEFCDERYRMPIGKFPDGTPNFLKVDPTYFALEGDKLLPTFVLGWSNIPFDRYQKQLISSIIWQSILTRQDFIGSDAQILTFGKDKWSRRQRIQRGWRASQYANLSMEDLQEQFDRFSRALGDVIAFLSENDTEDEG